MRPPVEVLNASPRCGAKTRSGHACRQAAVKGKRRCRMHGGTNPGAPLGNRNNWKHGRYSAESIAMRALIRTLTGQARELTIRIDG